MRTDIARIIQDTWPATRMSDDAADSVVKHLGVLPDIAAERTRQDKQWGQQNHHDGTGPGYLVAALHARHECQQAAALGLVTYRHILNEEVQEAFSETDPEKLRTELIQVAAVAVAWIEKLDRERASTAN